MDLFNFVIIGSGPAGVAAARRLENKGTCIVDVGETAEVKYPYSSLREGLASGDLDSMLGPHWEMLANLVQPNRTHTKLRAAAVKYVANGVPFKVYDSFGKVCLSGANSYAAGGMSNAWGAQLLRYNDTDLAEAGNWPISASELEPFYKDLEQHIGIAGEVDDMYSFLDGTADMLPSTPIVPAANYILTKYKAQKIKSPLRLGRSRLAILTKQHQNYPPFEFNEVEFFSTESPSLYTARRTLDELKSNEKITYLGGYEFIAFRELSDFVEVDLVKVGSEITKTIRTKHLLLGCGTLQTARLVILNKKAVGKKLPFIDHPPTLVPLFIPRMFGSTLPKHSFPVQLVATLDGEAKRDMISLYYPGALLWADLLADMPLPIDASLKVLPNLLGGMLVAQIWETSQPMSENTVSITPEGEIRIDYPNREPYSRLKCLLKALRPLGVYSHSSLAKMASPGWGFHYAACLPMRHTPNSFETHIDGRLWDSQRVRIIDGSVLPSLPAKNHSLTLMANAARIAEEALKCGY